MGNALLLQQRAQILGLGDGSGTHQHRLSGLVQFHDFFHDRPVLGRLGLVDHVRVIGTDHGLVGRNHDNIQAVDLLEFLFFRLGRTGHAGQLFVHTEIILECDGSQRLAFTLHHHAFLGFNGLVQAFGIPAPVHETSGKFVDDDDLSVFHHIIPVADHQGLGLDGAHNMVGEVHAVLCVVQVADAQRLFRFGDTCLGRRNLFLLFVNGIIFALFHVGHDTGNDFIEVRGLFAGAGNDQRGTGFVYQDGVHFVHDAVIQFPLHHLVLVHHHVVTEVVKTELVVGAVGDIRLVRSLPFREIDLVYDQADGQAQEIIDTAHIDTVAAGQIIVDGDHMNALAGQRIQIYRQGRHQGLAFTGTHFRNLAPVQHHAADQLHIKMPHAGHALGRFPHHRKRFRQNVVEGLAFLQTQFEFRRLRLQVGVAHPLHVRFQRVDLIHDGPDIFQFLFIGISEYLLY